MDRHRRRTRLVNQRISYNAGIGVVVCNILFAVSRNSTNYTAHPRTYSGPVLRVGGAAVLCDFVWRRCCHNPRFCYGDTGIYCVSGWTKCNFYAQRLYCFLHNISDESALRYAGGISVIICRNIWIGVVVERCTATYAAQ